MLNHSRFHIPCDSYISLRACTPRIGLEEIAPRKKIIVHPGCTFLVVAPRAPRNFGCAPGSTSSDLPSFPEWWIRDWVNKSLGIGIGSKISLIEIAVTCLNNLRDPGFATKWLRDFLDPGFGIRTPTLPPPKFQHLA